MIDTDPGTDDAIALWLALASPELDVRLVSVVGGNAGLARTLPNARAIVGLTGRDVPVVAGADRPLVGAFVSEPRVHGADGLGGVILPEGPPAMPGVAADAIRAALRAAPAEGLTLVGIGPATNLALALATEPALSSRVREIVLMAGAVGEGNITPAAEFNAWSDPEALAVLLAAGRPVTLA
ncbi:MAG: nucleoside hydrolase, partial [Nevskia sp.]|nr:nucleoside hydrolase [Nevskia sp.]